MSTPQNELNRRGWLKTAGAGAAALAASAYAAETQAADTVVKNGRIKQSVVQWCFSEGVIQERGWSVEKTIEIAKGLGCESVELIAPKYFPILKKHGL
ncbi:MAG: twin-arginine translocation signal domain-containing protein, partial [Planctomycetales bacterium]